MNGRRFLTPAALIPGALALAATLALAGCGGSSSGSAAAAVTDSPTATASAGLSAFQTCLKQHGVTIKPGEFGGRPRGSFSPGARPTDFPTDFPSGSPRPHPSFTGTLSGADSAAFKACAKYAPAGFGGGFGRTISSSALAAFKSCLSQNGVKVTGTTAVAVLAELRNATGKTASAVKTCRVLLQPSAPSPSPST